MCLKLSPTVLYTILYQLESYNHIYKGICLEVRWESERKRDSRAYCKNLYYSCKDMPLPSTAICVLSPWAMFSDVSLVMFFTGSPYLAYKINSLTLCFHLINVSCCSLAHHTVNGSNCIYHHGWEPTALCKSYMRHAFWILKQLAGHTKHDTESI